MELQDKADNILNCTWYKVPLRLLVLHSISSLFHLSHVCCSPLPDHID